MATAVIKSIAQSELTGLYVRIYKNLHNGLFSVQYRGRVIAHVEQITLANVSFTVQPAARLKVIQTKQKVVHAFVNGIVAAEIKPLAKRASYNPYLASTFVDSAGKPLQKAEYATLLKTGIWL